MKGILFDAPQVIEGARPKIEAAGLGDRIETVAGDFFKSVPEGGMLVMTGGKERTAKEFEQLLAEAGFKLRRVIPTELPTSIVEAEPV